MRDWDYEEFVAGKLKDPVETVFDFNATRADIMHGVVGIAKEAGELLDAGARLVFYNKPLDLANVIEELGDIEFFMAALRRRLNISRDEVISANVVKLSTRYKDKFSTDEANARADKVLGE